MDNHPIPQDVTGFQFRLIGDMTIKQFAYLAAGVVLAWICLSLPLFILVKFPLVVLFAGLGVLLAFIPLGGRPADSMILYFLKAVFSPTQYVYKTQPMPSQVATTVGQPEPKEDKKNPSSGKTDEKVTLSAPLGTSSFDVLFGQQQKPQPEEKPQALPQPQAQQPLNQENEEQLVKEEDTLAKALQEAKQEEKGTQKGTEEEQEAHKKVNELETELQTILAQKQGLEARLVELQKQLEQKPQQVFNPSVAQAPKITENVRKIPPNLSKTIGAPFATDVPNLICGIIKDPRGNVLPNILIEVQDKDGNPVRAFKTNPLGQFASATPVINGTYAITFEDPNGKHRFDSVEIQATGAILPPLEVISVDAREDLRKELFG